MTDYRQLFDLNGKTMLVLGSASGIGRGSARVLAGLGAHVICSDVDEAGVAATAAEIGGDVLLCDAADAASVAALADTIATRYARLDAAVTTPGINVRKRIVDFDEADFDRIVALNLKGTFLFLRAFLKLLIAQGRGGSIVASSSVRAVTLEAGLGVYASTKAGIGQLVSGAAAEAGEYNIRVNAIAPSIVETALTVPLKEKSRRGNRRGRRLSRLRRGQLRQRLDAVRRRRLDRDRRTAQWSDADASERLRRQSKGRAVACDFPCDLELHQGCEDCAGFIAASKDE